jgi:hypothetical protein
MTLLQMETIVSQRLNEAAMPVFYPSSEIIAALNEANRLFALMTLCVERTSVWNVAANTTFFKMLTVFPDWLAPLRIESTDFSKVRPSRLSELWSLDAQWPVVTGRPKRYAAMGGDLVALYPHPTALTLLPVRYAGAPALLAGAGDVPEIPADYHDLLPKYSIYRLRMAEGAEEFAATLPLLQEFLEGAVKLAQYVKARNVGFAYDTVPPELAGYDMSRLIPKVKKYVA